MEPLNFNTLIKKSNYHRPIIFNGLLWSLAFVIMLFIFSKGQTPVKIDYIYTISFLSAIAIPVLINFYILIPKLLKKEKYVAFFIAFALLLFIYTHVIILTFEPILYNIFPGYFFISYLSNTNLYIVVSIFLVSTTLLKLAEDWFYFNRNENRLLKLKNLEVETQLSSLRAQINPHFLFNSLNVIYALALEKKQTTTKAIVQLSDILRYVIYDSDVDRVSIEDEIGLIQNYIEFQNHRVANHDLVDFEIDVEDMNYKIYPMLLLPLVENSFKYGLTSTSDNDRVRISLIQKNNRFEFQISNKNLNTKNEMDLKHSGVGLENIRNNLNLVYPNQHEFKIEETSEYFKVSLIINEIDEQQ